MITIRCSNIKYAVAEEALVVMKEIGFEPAFVTELTVSVEEDEVAEFALDPKGFLLRAISGVNDYPVDSFDFAVI